MVLGSSPRRRRLLGRMPRAAARELEYEQPRPRLRPSAGVFVLLVLHSVRTQRRVSTFGPSRMRGLLLKLCSLLVCALRVDRLPLAEHDMLPVDSCSTHSNRLSSTSSTKLLRRSTRAAVSSTSKPTKRRFRTRSCRCGRPLRAMARRLHLVSLGRSTPQASKLC